MADKIRIAVVDDHPLFRDGVALTLSRDKGFEVVGQGGSGDQALRIAEDVLPDVMLLDINLPGGGIETVGRLAAVSPVTKVVMLTASENEEHVSAALEAGAVGYVLKGIGAQELMRTIQAIHAGETYVTPALAARLLTRMKARTAPPAKAEIDPVGLTQREEEILDCVANGRTNKEIARELKLSEKTVKHYMTNIMHKLQVRNRVEAALAVRNRATARASGA
jgi:DNA-binding NarL/FixJ family response regulator